MENRALGRGNSSSVPVFQHPASMRVSLDHGIRLFNEREFFVCHEVLEEIWRPARGPRRFFLQSVIHLAVGFHHFQRGNKAGSVRQLGKGLRKLAGYLPACEGIDTALLYRESLACLDLIQRGAPVATLPTIVFLNQRTGYRRDC